MPHETFSSSEMEASRAPGLSHPNLRRKFPLGPRTPWAGEMSSGTTGRCLHRPGTLGTGRHPLTSSRWVPPSPVVAQHGGGSRVCPRSGLLEKRKDTGCSPGPQRRRNLSPKVRREGSVFLGKKKGPSLTVRGCLSSLLTVRGVHVHPWDSCRHKLISSWLC